MRIRPRWRPRKKIIWNFMKNLKNEKIAKNLEKIVKKYLKRRFWRSYAQTDVTIEFYAKNYPYRLIFKSVRLKIAENRFLASSDHPWQNNNCCLFKNISLKRCKQNVQSVFSFIFAADGTSNNICMNPN